jgi:uncharacterized protein YggU (UPF0235/DUF167 family)
MKIIVKAKPYSKEEKVEKIPQEGFDFLDDKMDMYKVWIKEVPEDGKANEAVIKALAKYFDTAKSNIELIKGATSSEKVFNINI